jgi:putative AlgH/UPF0301 family transcriptional regulator
MEPLSLTDHFLIAMPNMADPLFARSLVYLCEHGDHGAMGLIVNKPSGIAMAQLFDQIDLPLEIDPCVASRCSLAGRCSRIAALCCMLRPGIGSPAWW